MEFIAGEEKPFTFMINNDVFFGTCEHSKENERKIALRNTASPSTKPGLGQ